MFSQIAKPHGLMTMQPRTSEFSARSAAFTTCWYHSGKFSARVGLIAVWGCLAMWGEIGGQRSRGQNKHAIENDAVAAFYGMTACKRIASY